MTHLRDSCIAGLVAAVAALTGCSDANHSAGRRPGHRHAIVVQEYRERAGADSFWYWYIYATPNETSGSQRSGSATAYYYRSATPVTNFSSVPFTRVSGNLPKIVEDELEKSERLADEKVDEEQEPQEVVDEEAVESPSENSGPQTVDSPTETMSSSETSSSESSGSDPGSSD